MSPLAEIGILVFLLFANGVFALAEIAVVSSRKARLQSLSEAGVRGAKTALALASEPDRFLSTVQVGITLVGIFAGAFGGASLAEDVSGFLSQVPLLAAYSSQLGFLIVVGTITYFSLIIGELIPKQIGLSNPEGCACIMAPPMALLAKAASPLVAILSASSNLVLKVLPLRGESGPVVTDDEVRVLLREGARAGVFHAEEQQIVSRVLRVGDQPVGELMTPRPDVMWLSASDPLAENIRTMVKHGYSHYPVCGKSVDNVLGVVALKDIWRRTGIAEPVEGPLPSRIEDLLRQPLTISEAMPAFDAVQLFRKERQHFALVLDEYGGLAGVITDHDILEALVGGLGDGDDPDVVRREDGSFLLSGRTNLDDLKELLGVREFPGQVDAGFHTVAGLLLHQLRRLPNLGEKTAAAGWEFEVVDRDGTRIDKVLARKQG